MKKTILFITSLYLTLSQLLAQVPNGGFENWIAHPFLTIEEPDGWITSNLFIIAGIPNTVSKTNVAYAGSEAIVLNTITYNKPFSGTDTAIGYSITGKALGLRESDIKLGFPIGSRPSNITGYYKFSSPGKDTAAIVVGLHEWNPVTNSRDSIGGAAFVFYENTSNYTSFVAPVLYSADRIVPDTAIVYIASSITALPIPGTGLTLDNLILTGATNSIFKSTKANQLNLYPNPAQHSFEISNMDMNAAFISLKNIQGATLISKNISPSADNNRELINLADLSEGIYFVEILDENATVIQRAKLAVKK
jgi:hypothetical protein